MNSADFNEKHATPRRYTRVVSTLQRAVISTAAEESREAGAWGRVERSRECLPCHADTRHSHEIVGWVFRCTRFPLQRQHQWPFEAAHFGAGFLGRTPWIGIAGETFTRSLHSPSVSRFAGSLVVRRDDNPLELIPARTSSDC